jgi:hypothetical protein
VLRGGKRLYTRASRTRRPAVPGKGESQDFNKKRARTSFRLSTTTAPSGLISFAAILA